MSDNGRKIFGRDTDPASTCRVFTVDLPNSEISFLLKELSYEEIASLKPDSAVRDQLALMLVDESGKRLYSTEEEIKTLDRMSQAVMLYLLQQALIRNGASKEAAESILKN